MKVLERDDLAKLPPHPQVMELVESRTECDPHLQFMGVECVPVREIVMVSDRYRQGEPIILHCERGERCERAGAELDRLGYTNVFRYEGGLEELEPLTSGIVPPEAPEPVGEEFAALIGKDDLKWLLENYGLNVTLIDVVNNDLECPMHEEIRCAEVGNFEDALAGVDRGHTLVIHCEPNIPYRAMIGRAHEAGFDDVRVFEQRFESVI